MTKQNTSESFDIEVHQDHLERIVRADPISSIAELIWNALDADATEVYVEIEEGPLTKLGAIRVTDNGEGIKIKMLGIYLVV